MAPEDVKKYYEEKFINVHCRIDDVVAERKSCQQDVQKRLKDLEVQMAAIMAGATKGAILIGACSFCGAIIAVILTKLL